MIFVTVGTQLPFDRMVEAVDGWAKESGVLVVGQVGPTQRRFSHIRQLQFCEPVDFERHFDEASVVVAHAGMGSIIGALSKGKTLVVVPRRADLGEHRNDHQAATAKRFSGVAGVNVVWDEREVGRMLYQLLSSEEKRQRPPLAGSAPAEFLHRLRELIDA